MSGSSKRRASGDDKSDQDDQEVTISINKNGVSITPAHTAKPVAAASAAASQGAVAASAASAAASATGASASISNKGVEIKLPPGADSQAVREAVEEARTAVVDAIRESQEASAEQARDAADQAKEAADQARQSVEANKNAVRTIRRIRSERQEAAVRRPGLGSSSSPRRS